MIIGIELSDYWGTVNGFIDNGDNDGIGFSESHIKPDTKLISISSIELNTKSNYQDFQRFQVVDVDDGGRRGGDAAGADRSGEGRALPADRKAAIEARGEAIRRRLRPTGART